MIMDCEDYSIFTDSLELHYIDMNAYAKAVNEACSIEIDDTDEVMFAKWLAIITQKEINDKTIIEDVCKEEVDIQLAVSTLVRQGEDKIIRQAYQRRQDEIYFYNKNMSERDEYKRRAEMAEIALVEKDAELEEKDTELEKKDAELEKKDAENERLQQELAKLRAKYNE